MVSVLITGCGTLPKVTDKPISKALAKPASGPLVVASDLLADGQAGTNSSILLLEDNGEALMWRLALIDSARSSIDIHLYLWHSGASSTLLFDRLLDAADRGVRVRLLVRRKEPKAGFGSKVLSVTSGTCRAERGRWRWIT